MKKIIMAALLIAIVLTPVTAHAKKAKTHSVKYTKSTTRLYSLPSPDGQVKRKVGQNVKLDAVSSGKKYTHVRIGGKDYFVKNTQLSGTKIKAKHTPKYFKRMGVVQYNGYRWTWYSQRVLPGGGLKIPGRHVNGGGYIADKDGYIVLASSTIKKGTIKKTPFGYTGKIYDSGCAVGTIDVYVNW